MQINVIIFNFFFANRGNVISCLKFIKNNFTHGAVECNLALAWINQNGHRGIYCMNVIESKKSLNYF